MTDVVRIAAIQAAPVFLDRAASAAKACTLIAEAAARGARLAAFGETWLPGYPRWVNAAVSARVKRELGGRYLEQGVDIPGPEIEQLCAAAKAHAIDVVIGVAERDRTTRGTIYCTLVTISSEGELLGAHRKLKPTFGERFAWGDGDGSGLRVHQRPYAAISGLNCWEHNMVLPGYVLMAEGTQIHVAAFPGYESRPSGTRQLLLSQAFASQAAAYVILVGGVLRPDDVPDPEVRAVVGSLPPFTGDSYLIDPTGEVLVGPGEGETILVADADLAEVRRAKAMCDVAGHYSRPDVLRLHVDRRRPARLVVEP